MNIFNFISLNQNYTLNIQPPGLSTASHPLYFPCLFRPLSAPPPPCPAPSQPRPLTVLLFSSYPVLPLSLSLSLSLSLFFSLSLSFSISFSTSFSIYFSLCFSVSLSISPTFPLSLYLCILYISLYLHPDLYYLYPSSFLIHLFIPPSHTFLINYFLLFFISDTTFKPILKYISKTRIYLKTNYIEITIIRKNIFIYQFHR